MMEIKFNYIGTCGFSNDKIQAVGEKLTSEIKRLNIVASNNNYNDNRASINLPNENIGYITELAKSFSDIEYLVLIGIGGSNLGTIAVFEAIKGKLYNQTTNKTRVLFADTVDPDTIAVISKLIKNALKSDKRVILNVITKSGTTTETIANFHLLLNVLKKYKNYKENVVVTTDKDSKLYDVAKSEGFNLLEIPKKIGGRYSVFSAVGLFPLKIVGVDIKKLLEGALDMRNKCLNRDIFKNPAAVSAIILYLHNKNWINISDNFFFANDLESIGKWCRQLMAESIGKEYNVKSQLVNVGITPTLSLAVDLHSMTQLYLAGPYDKYTTFVTINHFNNKIKIPAVKELTNLAKVDGKGMAEIMNSISKAVMIAYKKRKRPYSVVSLHDKSEYSIGQFLQFKMMEVMYLGYLLGVNPFDQPNVEDYKKEVRL